MESGTHTSSTSGTPSARSVLKSFVLHLLVALLLLLLPTEVMKPVDTREELEVVFHRPRKAIEVPVKAIVRPVTKDGTGIGPRPEPSGSPGPKVVSKAPGPSAPEAPGTPGLPPGPESAPAAPEASPREKAGNAGILAFRDKFASLSKDRVTPRLGAEARYSAADEVGRASARSGLTTASPGSSGGINIASLNRSVGGGGGGVGGGRGGGSGGAGGGGVGGGAGGGGGGLPVTRATSAITAVGGDDRPKARGGLGPSRTDEEIQIVFDRYKASFYRLYNRELRNNPTLQGKMVLKLTIEPDGSVSMCVLQSSDMDAPGLATQVVDRVKTINFGAKEGVQALTIVYPIDFLPAA
jgi:hypothetical protein